MCGIAGFFAQHDIASAVADAMMAALKNRGPDAQHIVRWQSDWSRVDDNAEHLTDTRNALIHARLSIIDPRPIADQPMQNDRGDIWICYNGEVYDWTAHAEELVKLGAIFHTRSDTEFILRAYEYWGIDMLPRLRGMFAIAILDLRIQKLWLIRDRMGLKPIVYSAIDGNLAFGSTVRSVLPFVPKAQREWNPHAIDAYLAHRYIPAPRTVFAKIQRLPNAHWLQFDLQSRAVITECYWQPPTAVQSAAVSEQEWLATLDAAIAMRTVSDRPLGVFLSSGIDSSTVAARLAASGHNQLQSFTAGFAEPDMDESPLAKQIAETLGFPNLTIPIPATIRDDIDRLISDLDEPFADPSAIPTWYLARETSQHVKVVLGGDGGDEMFAGYKRFEKHLKTSWRRTFLGGNNSWSTIRDVGGSRSAKFIDEARMDWWHAYSLRFSGFTPSQRAVLQPAIKNKSLVYWRGMSQNSPKTPSPLRELLAIDQQNYLPEYILRKGDLCTMAHGLELRAPLLDHHWVGMVAAMPDSQRFTKPAKLLFKKAMPQLDKFNLFEAKKKGFNPPLNAWLKTDLAERLQPMPALLEAVSDGQISARATSELLRIYGKGRHQLAEQILQLLFLQISLGQLDNLRKELP